jgi:hypothetical protein
MISIQAKPSPPEKWPCGGRRDYLLSGEQVVGVVDLPVTNQRHYAIRDRRHHIGSQDHTGVRALRIQGDDPVHSPGLLQGLGDRVGTMLLDREAESQHAASLGTGRDGPNDS